MTIPVLTPPKLPFNFINGSFYGRHISCLSTSFNKHFHFHCKVTLAFDFTFISIDSAHCWAVPVHIVKCLSTKYKTRTAGYNRTDVNMERMRDMIHPQQLLYIDCIVS